MTGKDETTSYLLLKERLPVPGVIPGKGAILWDFPGICKVPFVLRSAAAEPVRIAERDCIRARERDSRSFDAQCPIAGAGSSFFFFWKKRAARSMLT